MGTKLNLPERLPWLERALQGLAFWIGHRHSHFDSYPLTEGALVAEACNLIQSNLSHDRWVLLPECLYRNLIPVGRSIAEVTKQARADLVICSKSDSKIDREHNVSSSVDFVVEVKRGSAPKAEIDKDLRRLFNFLCATDRDTRTFLIVVSEGQAPIRFVRDGKSFLGKHHIPNSEGHYRVRRTVKAASSFSRWRSAHYVCLIEVFRHQSDPVTKI